MTKVCPGMLINMNVLNLIVSLWVFVVRVAQSAQNNKFTISLQHLKENVKDEVYFLPQINVKGLFTMILSF